MTDVDALLAQIGRLDNRPETIAAMGRALAAAWAALESSGGYPSIAEMLMQP